MSFFFDGSGSDTGASRRLGGVVERDGAGESAGPGGPARADPLMAEVVAGLDHCPRGVAGSVRTSGDCGVRARADRSAERRGRPVDAPPGRPRFGVGGLTV